jgi:phosphatidylethanolamine/phosphatidyl-N-methylethanolamine N-methyltransferase
VSGIPFSTMPLSLGRQIVSSLWDSLAPRGRFVAYQFRDRVASLGRELLGDPQVDVELLNVPPMRFYRWDKPANPVRHGINGNKHNGENLNGKNGSMASNF